MPRIHPFHAIRYATPEGDVSTRIAPPYDVLDEQPKRALLGRDEHNVVAVDLPVTPPKTVGPDSAYAEAGNLLRRWLDDGTLRRHDQPALFAYEQKYEHRGQRFARRGLFAAVELEPFNRPGGGVFRHEHTIQGGLDDRFKLMQATRAQLSPIFGTFRDPAGHVADRLAPTFERKPDFHGVTEHDGVEHRCWRVADETTISALHGYFLGTDVFIADGHHRYTTALEFHRVHPRLPGAARCLFVLVAAEDPGMIVLPTHRVISNMQGFTMERLAAQVATHDQFVLRATEYTGTDLDRLAAGLPETDHHAMGLYDPQTDRGFVLTTRSADPLKDALPDKAEVWRRLDVAVLHELLIDRLIRPEFGGERVRCRYTPETAEVADLSRADPNASLGVVVQSTPLDAVIDVSHAGEVMPPKSTFFYPKVATGLVINPLD